MRCPKRAFSTGPQWSKSHCGNENVDVTILEAVTQNWHTADHKLLGVENISPCPPGGQSALGRPKGLAPLRVILLTGGSGWPPPHLCQVLHPQERTPFSASPKAFHHARFLSNSALGVSQTVLIEEREREKESLT